MYEIGRAALGHFVAVWTSLLAPVILYARAFVALQRNPGDTMDDARAR